MARLFERTGIGLLLVVNSLGNVVLGIGHHDPRDFRAISSKGSRFIGQAFGFDYPNYRRFATVRNDLLQAMYVGPSAYTLVGTFTIASPSSSVSF